MNPDPATTARIDQIAARPEVIFELAYYGDFYVAIDDETGEIEHFPRPEETR